MRFRNQAGKNYEYTPVHIYTSLDMSDLWKIDRSNAEFRKAVVPIHAMDVKAHSSHLSYKYRTGAHHIFVVLYFLLYRNSVTQRLEKKSLKLVLAKFLPTACHFSSIYPRHNLPISP